jgi:hypothetical protein
MHTIFWLENLVGRDNLKDSKRDGNITVRMDLRELGWEGVDWIHLVQDR